MTLINALETLKAKGITHLVGMCNSNDINDYISNAQACHDDAVKYSAMGVETWKDSLEREDDNFIVETKGHHIVATHYSDFDMPTYGDYETEEEMTNDFDEWNILRQAKEIADEKVAQGSDIDHTVWMTVAAHELFAAYAKVEAEFNKTFA